MMRAPIWLLMIWSLCAAISPLVIGSAESNQDDVCPLYLAETLDDKTGALTMGVFAGHSIPAGTMMETGDLVIPVVDFLLHYHHQENENMEKKRKEKNRLLWWSQLFWDAHDVGGHHEGTSVQSLALGLGSLSRPTSFDNAINAAFIQSTTDDSTLHRSRDPGAGAMSYYNGAGTITIQDINPGEEIIFHYHPSFPSGMKDIYHDDQLDDDSTKIPLDNPRVQEFWKRYEQLEQQYGELRLPGANEDEFKAKLWGILQDSPLDSSVERLFLPYSWTEAERLVAHHVTHKGRRTPEWLQQNGICISDTIEQGYSTVFQAGRGAFATKFMPKGSVIATTPLIHMIDRDWLGMFKPTYHFSRDHTAFTNTMTMSEEIHQQQLLLNYCFGHRESTKLLCPVGTGTPFINHSPTPNAYVRWSTKTDTVMHRPEWLNMTLEQLNRKREIGLMIEYVALHDIEEDEEIFIHYGHDWEKAWHEHTNQWEERQERIQRGQEEDIDKGYISAEDLNSMDIPIIHTVEEQRRNHPYPDTVMTSCHYDDSMSLPHKYGDDEETIIRSGIMVEDENGQTELRIKLKHWGGLDPQVPSYYFLRPCRVLKRKKVDTAADEEVSHSHEYTVQILNHQHHHTRRLHAPEYYYEDDILFVPRDEMLIVQRMPRDAIKFTDFAYTTDMHMPNAFRHEMMMDDGIFPYAWRDLRSTP